MASKGFTLGEIQLVGEWTSKTAPFFYMNSDMADHAQELRMLVEQELQDDHDVESDEEVDDSGRESGSGKRKMEIAQLQIPPPPGLDLVLKQANLGWISPLQGWRKICGAHRAT